MNKMTRNKTTKKSTRPPVAKAAAKAGAPAKVRVATMWLSGCSGCHMSFLDLDERLVDLFKLIDVLFSPIVDTKVKDMPQVDVGIVEGCVNNTDQEHELKMMRDRCKILIAIGDCAINGNIPALRNQFPLKDCLARAYEQAESNRISCIPNDPVVPGLCPKARPLQEVVKVDFSIPGCPPDADMIWYALTELLAGRTPQWNEKNLRYD
ncbi:MAG: NADP oxidoreductase [Verrucomicrobiota bacterium]|jgi:NAD-reducing hydrogenase small subunit